MHSVGCPALTGLIDCPLASCHISLTLALLCIPCNFLYPSLVLSCRLFRSTSIRCPGGTSRLWAKLASCLHTLDAPHCPSLAFTEELCHLDHAWHNATILEENPSVPLPLSDHSRALSLRSWVWFSINKVRSGLLLVMFPVLLSFSG
jgi:hypothetical protein